MLDRLSTTIPEVTAAVAVADSDEIPYGSYAGGMIFVPANEAMITLTWHAAEKLGGTYLAAVDADNVAITQTVAAEKAYPIPSDLYGCRAIKATGNELGYMAVSLKG